MTGPHQPASRETTGRPGLRWLAGEDWIRAALEKRLALPKEALDSAQTIQTIQMNPRRTISEGLLHPDPARGDGPIPIVLKTHHLASGRHRLRERMKRLIGRSPARREWDALVVLHAAGVPVPRPLAYGRLASGDELLVFERSEGAPLAHTFACADTPTRLRLVTALASALTRLHASGHSHGDLHLGNLWLAHADESVVLLDLQRARRDRSDQGRVRDLASLELSLLRARWPAVERSALRSGLGLGAQADTALRRFAADHLRGRTRRVLRSGRGVSGVRAGRRHGLCDASISPSALLHAIESAEQNPARRARREGQAWIVEETIDGRAVVVKWTAAGGLGDRLVACWRGSRAARAFRKGSREQLLLGRSARPLAYLEERTGGLPGASWLVLERVGDTDLDRIRPATPGDARALALAFGDWLAELHALGLGHADLKGSNLRVGSRDGNVAALPDGAVHEFWLLDLEDLIGPAAQRDEARLTALAQLNASLPDEHFDVAARETALARYLARLPFENPQLGFEGARREIARRSLARGHRWRGEGCALEKS
jgi:tRNA A-37 threonylcarbamoyl transferase component Bud32